jgi:thioredoxin-dependent peroxiredoxin
MKSIILLGMMFIGVSAWALQPGDAAPDMEVDCTNGSKVNLTDHKGSWVVVFFYPRAFTPGCTAQSCSMRDDYSQFKEAGIVVYGASLDNLERQNAFKKEYELPYELLADPDKRLAKAFDTLGMGGMIASRNTFIINPEGKIAHRFNGARTSGHAEEVMTKLKSFMD